MGNNEDISLCPRYLTLVAYVRGIQHLVIPDAIPAGGFPLLGRLLAAFPLLVDWVIFRWRPTYLQTIGYNYNKEINDTM